MFEDRAWNSRGGKQGNAGEEASMHEGKCLFLKALSTYLIPYPNFEWVVFTSGGIREVANDLG